MCRFAAPDPPLTTSPTPAASHSVPNRSASQPPPSHTPTSSNRVRTGLATALVSLWAGLAPALVSSLLVSPPRALLPLQSRAACPAPPASVLPACRVLTSPACLI